MSESPMAFTVEIKGDRIETKCPFCDAPLKARIDRRLSVVTYRAKCGHFEWPEVYEPGTMLLRFRRTEPAHVKRITENKYGTATALGRASDDSTNHTGAPTPER